MERKLAHIEQIEWIKPIEGADKIELCRILGWQTVVAKRDNFQVGDKVIFIEVDSILPELPQYEFLRDRKFRVRTIKLKGQVSQGLVLPISILPEIESYFSIGQDVTDILGITKYLSPSERQENEEVERKAANEKNKLKKFMMRYSWFRKMFLSRKQKAGFPYWVSKTDEERIQNIPGVLERFKDEMVYATEKIDYQSVTFTGQMVPKYSGLLGKIITTKKYKFVVCSRNLTTNDKGSLYWKMAEKYGIEEILKRNPNLTIQAEQGSSGVQGNKYGLKEPQMWVFNIINHETGYHFDYSDMYLFCDFYGIPVVPLITQCRLHEIGSTVEDVVNFSKGKSVVADIPREGVVIRSIRDGKKILSFKAINPDFLLKYE